MAVFDNINTSYASGVAPEVTKYFDRTLLKNAEGSLVYQRDLQKKKLPLHNGKTVQFRKMQPYALATTPLKEGVTPDGKTIRVTEQHVTIKPYGDYISFTDELNLTLIDDVLKENAELLSRQANETLNAIAGKALNGGKNVVYADANGAVNTSRADIAAGDVLTSAHIKRAVRTLEAANAKRFADGYFHGVVDPYTKYDLTADPLWVDVAKYQNSEKVEQYELGKILGVKFYETTETITFPATQYLYGTTAEVALNGGSWNVATATGFATIAKTTAGANEGDQDYFCRQMVGQTVRLYDSSATAYFNALIDQCMIDGNNIKMTFRYVDTNANWTYGSGDKIVAQAGGASGTEVHSTLIYGTDFGGDVSLGGEGGSNIQSILNPVGSSGALDPLSQRGTMGWKVKGYAVTILQDAYGVRIEHAVSE